MANDIYVIDEQVRQALIAIITKAVHPNVSFEQVDTIRRHLEEMKPVQVREGPPEESANSEETVSS